MIPPHLTKVDLRRDEQTGSHARFADHSTAWRVRVAFVRDRPHLTKSWTYGTGQAVSKGRCESGEGRAGCAARQHRQVFSQRQGRNFRLRKISFQYRDTVQDQSCPRRLQGKSEGSEAETVEMRGEKQDPHRWLAMLISPAASIQIMVEREKEPRCHSKERRIGIAILGNASILMERPAAREWQDTVYYVMIVVA